MSSPLLCWCHEFISTITVLLCFWGRVPVMVFRFQVYYALQIACHYGEFPSECTSQKCILPELPPCQERTRVSWGGRTIRVPTRTGKPGKPGKMGRHFPVREKSGNFEQTGKVRENHTKYWKTEINWDKYYLIFLVIFKWTVHYLLKWIKFSVKKTKHQKSTGKMAKNTGKVREKSGNFVSPEKWEPWQYQLTSMT